MKTLSIDLETYSSANISKTGVYRYCEAPDFEILLFSKFIFSPFISRTISAFIFFYNSNIPNKLYTKSIFKINIIY